MTWPFAHLWDQALEWDAFVHGCHEQRTLWQGATVRVPSWAVQAASFLPGRFRLIAIAEDWCGDGATTLPVIARWAAQVPNVRLRVLRRDDHPAVMDRYLTGGSRSIPIVIVLDDQMMECASWGPRPDPLAAWVREQRALGREQKALYPEIRRWYAKDRGETTLREILGLMTIAPVGAGARA